MFKNFFNNGKHGKNGKITIQNFSCFPLLIISRLTPDFCSLTPKKIELRIGNHRFLFLNYQKKWVKEQKSGFFLLFNNGKHGTHGKKLNPKLFRSFRVFRC